MSNWKGWCPVAREQCDHGIVKEWDPHVEDHECVFWKLPPHEKRGALRQEGHCTFLGQMKPGQPDPFTVFRKPPA